MPVSLCEAAWLLEASALKNLTFSWDLPQLPMHSEKKSLELPTEGEEKWQFLEKFRTLFFLTGLPSKEMILLEACLLGFFWKLSELGEGKYPTQAH